MRILFDQGTPVPLRRYLAGHSINIAFERGWSNLPNGLLFEKAEEEGYELLITTDQKLQYQQNLADRKLAVLALLSTSQPRIQHRVDDTQAVVDAMGPGDFREAAI